MPLYMLQPEREVHIRDDGFEQPHRELVLPYLPVEAKDETV